MKTPPKKAAVRLEERGKFGLLNPVTVETVTGDIIAIYLEPVHDLSQNSENIGMRKKTYPSDMSRERFEQIRPLL
ncbi:hypothetical protein, partial [Ralstonia chuxiongensis]|uniref:hypothetical protein n=1 Tax=Ralstonia chuxiongensis TaxID=2957504 RepID=UPI00292F5149